MEIATTSAPGQPCTLAFWLQSHFLALPRVTREFPLNDTKLSARRPHRQHPSRVAQKKKNRQIGLAFQYPSCYAAAHGSEVEIPRPGTGGLIRPPLCRF